MVSARNCFLLLRPQPGTCFGKQVHIIITILNEFNIRHLYYSTSTHQPDHENIQHIVKHVSHT